MVQKLKGVKLRSGTVKGPGTRHEDYSDKFSMEPFCMVICGGAGDLSQRKLLPTLYHLYQEGRLPHRFSIVGFGIPDMSDGAFRSLAKKAIQKFSEHSYNKRECFEFSNHIFYVGGDFERDESYAQLKQKMKSHYFYNKEQLHNVLYYMAVPPVFFPAIADQLRKFQLQSENINPRIIIEKPFGHNKKTAIELNDALQKAFRENEIYRIDHYLGKETVQNIIFFRFSNSIFEPLWNRRYIDNVQITVAEDIGIEHRGSFYEKAGVIRDIIQNHMMQLIALIAMEPPVGFAPDLVRNEKVKIFKSLRAMDRNAITDYTVLGQYGKGEIAGSRVIAYRSEKNVSPRSMTPTFFAARIYIDNWRWADVPFYIRAGKRLPKRLTEIVIQFKQPPLRLFGKTSDILEPSYLILTIQPAEAITLRYSVKYPNTSNRIYPVSMNFCYDDEFHHERYPAYSRLLLDCMRGDFTLFVRQDGIEAMWDFIDPITEQWENSTHPDFPNYAAGTWGAEAAQKLIEKDGRKWITDAGVYCGHKACDL